MFNASPFNGSAFNGSQVVQTVRTYSPDQFYILHLISSAGVFIRKIEGFTSGTWDAKINDPGTFTFTLPLTSTLVQTADLIYPNRVRLRDGSGERLKDFVIVKTTARMEASEYEVECAGLLYLLGQEYVARTGVAGSTVTIRAHVASLMGNQINAGAIPTGYLAQEYAGQTVTVGEHSDASILSALMELRKQVGGYIDIDNGGRLTWRTTSTDSAKYVLSLREDIATYEFSIDTSKIANRIYAKGNIQTVSATSHIRPNLPDLGGGAFYIQDSTSQGLYGIRPRRISYPVESDAELALLAAATLARLKDPIITRNIGEIDLSRLQPDPDVAYTGFHPEYIYVGAKIRVEPPFQVPGDSTFNTMILSVKRDLIDPLLVEIEVGEIDTESTSGRGGGRESFFNRLADSFGINPSEMSQYDEQLWDAVEALWAAVDTSVAVGSVTPTSIAATAVVGVAAAASREDHVHFGITLIPFNGADTAVSDLGVPDPLGMAVGYLDDSAGVNEGFYVFPPNGATNADWQRIDTLIYDAAWTVKADLGNPQRYSRGVLDSGAGTLAGYWVYPPDGTTNADWAPESAYN